MKPLTLILVLAAAGMAVAQDGQKCDPEGCEVKQDGFTYRWLYPANADGTTIFLLRDNEQIGGYNRFEGYYRPLVGGLWGDAVKPPIPPPTKKKLEPWMVQGVDSDRVCEQGREVYSISGREVTKSFAESRIGADTFPDDSNKGWLLVISPDESLRKKVIADWEKEAAISGLREKTHVWSGTPEHMHMIDHREKKPLYHTLGNPTIYYMNAGGEVLHRQDDFYPGDFKALRKIDPTYDPKKDIDQRKKGDGILPGGVPLWMWLMGLGGAGVYVLNKNPQPRNA